MTDQVLLHRLRGIVGAANVITDARDAAPFEQDWRGRYHLRSRAVVRPNSTEQVAAVVRLCHEARTAIVPQAGNTGLVGGALPTEDGSAIVLNVGRLNRIRTVDRANNSITAEAGCVLADVRAAAETHDRYFPMMLGSVGSCQIGGLVSTNAGGTGVLRYGNMRDLTLGVEVVLPDGRVWNGLRALRKDNAGYDMKHMFIGAEGTLGVVTAAVLKLSPRLVRTATAMVALQSVSAAIELLHRFQAAVGNRIEAFEIMSRRQLELVQNLGPQYASPLSSTAPYFVLIELADSDPDWDVGTHLERTLEAAAEVGAIDDAIVAPDLSKADRIWALRHNISEANKAHGFTVANDTSVPISRLPEFMASVEARLLRDIEHATVCHVGHIGDGNIHVVAVLSREHYKTAGECEEAADRVNGIVHEESVNFDGSIAAEHGIGRMHVNRLERFKSTTDLAMMRSIKQLFDPLALMNPGKVLRQKG